MFGPVTAAAPASAEATPSWQDIVVVSHRVEFTPPRRVPTSVLCSCVAYAKWYVGKSEESWGNAWDIQPNTLTPYVGGMVLTYDGRGHIAVITKVTEGTITITEANFSPCQQTVRTIERSSPLIRGYFTP